MITSIIIKTIILRYYAALMTSGADKKIPHLSLLSIVTVDGQ